MKTNLRRWVLAVLAVGLMGLFAVLAGCASSGGYEGQAVVYSEDYYEPYGYNYGHWHPGYHVAPPRRDRGDHDRQAPAQSRPAPVQAAPVQSRPPSPTYRPAPPSRPAPSIPSKPRERSH